MPGRGRGTGGLPSTTSAGEATGRPLVEPCLVDGPTLPGPGAPVPLLPDQHRDDGGAHDAPVEQDSDRSSPSPARAPTMGLRRGAVPRPPPTSRSDSPGDAGPGAERSRICRLLVGGTRSLPRSEGRPGSGLDPSSYAGERTSSDVAMTITAAPATSPTLHGSRSAHSAPNRAMRAATIPNTMPVDRPNAAALLPGPCTADERQQDHQEECEHPQSDRSTRDVATGPRQA